MRTNKLMLNDGKTEAVFITRRHQQLPPESTSLLVRDSRVVAASAAKNLGVIFDNTMHMEKQVDALWRLPTTTWTTLEESGTCSVTGRQNSWYLPLSWWDSTMVTPSLLLGITKTQIVRLRPVQNMVDKIVTLTRRCEHITPVLHSPHWLPVSYRIQYKVLLLTFKAFNGQMLSHLTEMLQPYKQACQLCPTVQHLLTVPATSYLTAGDSAFQNAAPKLWDDLSATARACTSLDDFKSHLKTIFFVSAL